MIDKKYVGYTFPPVTLNVEEGRLMFFAKALGETRSIYTNPEVARKEGLPGILAPPTFPFILEIDSMDLLDLVTFLGQSLKKLLHGEENFVYHSQIYAGDKITVLKKIVDVIDKKEGELQFVIFDNNFTNQDNILVAETQTNYIFRHK
tara:strand:+ start:891 stop:1334 length:444 start_codon:yes stop_codon:yes gene_type:complete